MNAVLMSIQDGIATITLNRPEKLNAFNRSMALLLHEKLDTCASLHEIRAVYITGAGKGFSAGQDLGELTGPNPPAMSEILQTYYNPMVTKIRNLPKPVVAAVNGMAAGAGANLALCCDVVLASRSAAFIQAFAKVGLIPDTGGTFFLPRLLGWQKASAIMMLSDRITASEAEQMGMVYKVFEDDGFAVASYSIAQRLAQLPTRALALTKHALNQSCSNSLEQQLLLEDELQQRAAKSLDHAEGINAFLEKRSPLFTGL